MVLHTMVIIDAPQSPEKDLTVTGYKTVQTCDELRQTCQMEMSFWYKCHIKFS